MKNKFILFFCVLFVFAAAGTSFAQSRNLVRNGDFSSFARDWPNLPNDWNTTWRGGDGYEPIKTEAGRFIGWAERVYSFTLSQNITGLSAGTYSLSADFRLNPDSVAEDIVMNVYAGSSLLATRSVRNELMSAARETDIRYELNNIRVTGNNVRIEFAGTNILKYIGIDNVVFEAR